MLATLRRARFRKYHFPFYPILLNGSGLFSCSFSLGALSSSPLCPLSVGSNSKLTWAIPRLYSGDPTVSANHRPRDKQRPRLSQSAPCSLAAVSLGWNSECTQRMAAGRGSQLSSPGGLFSSLSRKEIQLSIHTRGAIHPYTFPSPYVYVLWYISWVIISLCKWGIIID